MPSYRPREFGRRPVRRMRYRRVIVPRQSASSPDFRRATRDSSRARPGVRHLGDRGQQHVVLQRPAKQSLGIPASKPCPLGPCPTVIMEELPHADRCMSAAATLPGVSAIARGSSVDVMVFLPAERALAGVMIGKNRAECLTLASHARPRRSMRLLPLILVIANLLLRGVAVPHIHDHDDAADHASRPHVHMASHEHSHSHGHDHHHGRRHVHHDRESEHAFPPSTPTPDHDDDAVYVAVDTLTVSACGPKVTHAVGHWLAIAPRQVFSPPSSADPKPRRVRPPGDGAVTIRTLLPHVLRV